MHRKPLILTIALMVSFWTAASPTYGQRPSRESGDVRSETHEPGVGDRALSPVGVVRLEGIHAAAPIVTVRNEKAEARIVTLELAEVSDGAGDSGADAAQAVDIQPLVLLSDQEIARGATAAAGGAEAIVYANTIDVGNFTVRGQRFNFAPTMSSTVVNSAGFSIPTNLGTFIADDMTLGGGWVLGDQISSFSAFVRRSGTDQTRFLGDGTARATVTLWDGDPINEIDTTGDGFASAPIPGASCDFTLSPEVPFSTLQNLKCNLATPITPAHDTVWMVLTSDSCRLFWPITLQRATLGSSRDLGLLGQDDDAGTLGSFGGPSTAASVGTCCNDGGVTTCGPSAASVDCPGDTGNAGGRCSDGDAETHLNFNFGGPCAGDPNTDSCVNYLAQINSPTETTMSLVPVGASGPHAIDGSTITVQPGSTVILELRLAGWDPDGDGSPKLKAWQACLQDLDRSELDFTGPIVPVSRACVTDADCASLFGSECSISGADCSQDADCPGAPFETCTSRSACSTSYSATPECAAGFIDTLRSDYVFFGLNDLPVVAFSSRDCRIASVLKNKPFVTDPGVRRYAGTIGVMVTPDALGEVTYGISMEVMVDENNMLIPLIGLIPTTITVATDPLLNVRKNRYLTITAGQPGVSQAIRVTFVDLPAPFDVLNGSSRWVGSPFDISESRRGPGPGLPGFADFKAASLGCDPFFMDWNTIGGVVQVLHEDIVPSGTYEIAVFNEGDLTTAVSSSTVTMSSWGDLVGPFDAVSGFWPAPDGSVDVPFDVIAQVDAFRNARDSTRKVRMDVDPATPNGEVDIVDIVRVLDAFAGKPYPFAPTIPPCGP